MNETEACDGPLIARLEITRTRGAPTRQGTAFAPGDVCFVIHAGGEEAPAPSSAEASVDGRPLVRPSDFNGKPWTRTVELGDLGPGPHRLDAVIASKPTSQLVIEVRQAFSLPPNAVGSIVPGEVLLKLTPEASQEYPLMPGSFIVLGGQVLVAVRPLPLGAWFMQLGGIPPMDETRATARTFRAVDAIKGDDRVQYAQANHLLQWSAEPNDPLFLEQRWHYGQIGLPRAWDITTGLPSVRIAVVDSGSIRHPDLMDPRLDGGFTDGCDFSSSGRTDPDPTNFGTYHHAAAVMGIIGARSNTIGGTGVCPGCRIVPVRMNINTDENIVRALDWAANAGRADIINMSFNSPVDDPEPTCGDHPAVMKMIGQISNRVLLVAAAGNNYNSAPNFPADCPDVLAVAASQPDGRLAPYSARGDRVDITAPGGGENNAVNPFFGNTFGCSTTTTDTSEGDFQGTQGVVTTWGVGIRGDQLEDDGFCYRHISGTSLAAPHISGVAGLMLSANPALSPQELARLLRESAQGRPVLDCPEGNCGAGLVDAHRAVRSARDEVQGPSVTPTIGAWWNPSRSGNGLDLQRMPTGGYRAVWYTYREDGTPIWYISDVAPVIGNRWEAPLYESRWSYDEETHALREIGKIELTLSDSSHGEFRWEIATAPDTTKCLADVNQGLEPFEVYHFGGTEQNGPANGQWSPPSQSGWGATLSQRGQTVVLTLYLYDSQGAPTWVQGLEEGSTQGLLFDSVYQTVNGTSLCPGCVGNTPLQYPSVGSASLDLPNPGGNSGELTVDVDYAATSGGWHRTVPIVRLSRN